MSAGKSGKRRRPAHPVYPIRPANLAVMPGPKRGRRAVVRSGARVRTVLYVQAEVLDWYTQAAYDESGKANRRNDYIERVLEEHRRAVEAAMGEDEN